MGDIVEPKTKGDQAEQKAAVADHRAEVVELQKRTEAAPPPTTKEVPPTRDELQLIDRLRKGKAYGRDAFMLEVMLGHKAGTLDYANAMLGVIQHQQGQDSFSQDWSQRLAREQTTIRGRFDSLEKATSEECDELRKTITDATTRTRDHVGYLEDMVHLQHQYLVALAEWLGRPWSKRFRVDLPDLPERKPLDKYLAENCPAASLPEKLKAATENAADLAMQLVERVDEQKQAEIAEYKAAQEGMRSFIRPGVPSPVPESAPLNPQAEAVVRENIKQAVEQGKDGLS